MTKPIIHHKYDSHGDITIWDGTTNISSFVDLVVVTVHGVPVLRFTSEQAPHDARTLANLIFHTNKEFAS